MNRWLHAMSLLGCFLMATVAQAGTEWVPASEVEEQLGMKIHDVTDKRGYWAGSVEEIEITFYDDGSVKTTGRVKIRITWVTDRTDYECHGVYVMRDSGLKDFTHRSLALRQCR